MSQAVIPLLTVLEQAARMAGFLTAAGRGLSGSEQDEMLHICNAMLDGMKIERCMMYQIIRTVFSTKANQQDYGVGDLQYQPQDGSAYWAIERPEKLYGAGFLVPNSNDVTLTAEVPMQVATTYEEWKNIVNKGVSSNQGRFLYYRATLPAGTASLWPVPNIDGQVTIYTPGTIDEFDDVNQQIMFPKGYREAMEYLLAVAAHHRHPSRLMDPDVPVKALEYKARIMRNQLVPVPVSSDPAVMQSPTLPGLRWYDARTYPGGF